MPVLILGIVQIVLIVLIIILEITSLGLSTYSATGAGIWCSIAFIPAAISTVLLVKYWARSRVRASRVLIAQIILLVFTFILIGIIGSYVSSNSITNSIIYTAYYRTDNKLTTKYQVKIVHVQAKSSESAPSLSRISPSAHLTDLDAVNSNSTSELLRNREKQLNHSSSFSRIAPETDPLKTKTEMPKENLVNTKKQFPLTLGSTLGIIAGVLGLAAVVMSTYVLVINSMTTIAATSSTTMMTLRWNSTAITIAGVGTVGVSANQFNYPFGMALDSSNALYISDLNNSRVQLWASNAWTGTTVAGQANGTSGTGSSYLNKAAGFAMDTSSNIYITDMYNSRIQYWTSGASTGVTVIGNGSCGNLTNQLCYPYNVIRDSSTGNIYVADTVNQRVVRYLPGASSGTVVAGGNGQGFNNYQLNYPIGLYYDSSTNSLVIANAGANNIVRWVIGASNWTLLAGSQNGTIGATSTLLYYPVCATFDLYGNMYVADTYNHRIQFFASGSQTGTTIAGVAGTQGSNSTLLKFPYTLILDNNLNMYVADSANQRIQNFLRY
ncbi:unnamed protein product [Rotaria magnacalcarata]|uniref:NHL repeat containing protein n=1 Tax=Rotaria magnacalcarata TaxID=392030 RepID=A0A815UZ41_9BILA|nr:unnamed protein product [Rotaria magnacalcarata]